MNKNILNFYLFANTLKEKIRQGFVEIGIKKERLESVAEHIFGTLILALGIDSEYELNLDMFKVLKMLILHELEEIIMPDYTVRSDVLLDKKINDGKKYVKIVTNGLIKQKEIEELLDEFNLKESNEAKFCYFVDKLESDFQIKIYDLQGYLDLEEAKKDLEYYGEHAEYIESVAHNPSDYWIEYHKLKYNDMFKNLAQDIQNLKSLNIEKEKR